jgi:tryptophan synthase alpha chain
VSGDLDGTLSALKAGGAKAFVPYVTGGFPSVDAALVRGLADAGADAVEVGLPFSDPVMDGPVIQEASRVALEAGTTAERVFDLVREASLTVPVAVMTYVNPVLAYGMERFAADAASAGVTGLIVPDLPVDEAAEWVQTLGHHEIAPVMLAAPNTTPARLARIAHASRGFVYCVASFGVTGSRGALGGSARALVEALRPLTPTPLYVGVGISTPEQAAEAVTFADGVVVGSALVEPLLRGERDETLRRAEAFRIAADT